VGFDDGVDLVHRELCKRVLAALFALADQRADDVVGGAEGDAFGDQIFGQ
jgi:hypothetical protein